MNFRGLQFNLQQLPLLASPSLPLLFVSALRNCVRLIFMLFLQQCFSKYGLSNCLYLWLQITYPLATSQTSWIRISREWPKDYASYWMILASFKVWELLFCMVPGQPIYCPGLVAATFVDIFQFRVIYYFWRFKYTYQLSYGQIHLDVLLISQIPHV